MEIKRFNPVPLLLALPGLAFSVSVPVPQQERTPILLAIPSADMLPHGEFRLSGRFQYFTTSQIGAGADTALSDSGTAGQRKDVQNLGYSSELLFGIENRAEVGFQYGQVFSLSIKALLLREDLLWPDVVFGVRNLFGSQEATLYGVTDDKTNEALKSESYMTIAKSFPSLSRVHLGLSVMPQANKGLVGVIGGLEQDLGGGAGLGYEVFERFSDFHQVLSLQWKYHNLVALSIGMTEFQSWIRQGGQWGFFLTPSQPLKDGYNSPGITIALQVLGWVPHRDKRTLPERVAILEVRNAELERELDDLAELKRQVADLQANALAPAPTMKAADSVPASLNGKTANGNGSWEKALSRLRSIADKMQSDLTDPKEIRELMAQIAGMGPPGADAMKRAAVDTSAAFANLRVPAILVMAYGRDTTYVTLLKALSADADAQVRREALTAYVKLANRAALDDVKRLLSDPDETVAMEAGEAYRQITGKAPPARAYKGVPSASKKRAKTK